VWAEDNQVAGVLLLHGLHPVGLADRVAQAVAAVRRASGGVGLRLVQIEGAGVRLRLETNDPLDADTLHQLQARIDEAFAALAPEIDSVWVETATAPPSRRIALPLAGGRRAP
jgi:hypothetical protein